MNHLSTLTPLQIPPVRAADRVPKKPVPVPERSRVGVEGLSIEDARALSIDTINALGKENPGLLARLISDAGQRVRGGVSTPQASLSRTALAFLLVDEKMRGKQLSDAEAAFLAAVVEDMTRHA
jgi:hypothetical protein